MCNRLGAKAIVPIFYMKGAIELITYTYFTAKLEEGKYGLNDIARSMQYAFNWNEDDYPLKSIIQVYYRTTALYRSDDLTLTKILSNGEKD